MKKSEIETKEGFTIVETALVIAIAGLIFLMMLVALPALQRSQRDAKRKEDIITFLEKVEKYQSTNRGALPGLAESSDEIIVKWDEDLDDMDPSRWGGFYRDYLGANFVDPTGENYVLDVLQCNGSITNANCDSRVSSIAGSLSNKIFPNDYKLYVIVQAKCAGDETKGVIANSNPRKIAVLYKLEGGGIHCAEL